MLNCFSYIHGITPKTVQLGDNQHVAIFHAIKQSGEAWSFTGGNRTADMFFNQSLGPDGKTGSLDFSALIFGGLIQGRDPAVSKNT
ncbi:hypothetical protein TUM4636_14090 [Shewanella glacialipiscicola]|uniref:Transposase n=1 Tax=Shewanella glacialipiscicola TaxID=614069 RepID=A0ABQ6JB01_9GAMM|nr:hypothetical protein TUM4636_14090 [Shewanella glacialipiscicola]GMA84350.1 hypothetical protein GCM10025855_38830 [Shewanella glacialipiscicola]GMA84445.1 hypothetical protein GCM10025855_39780 [Shewanella glacialipiscicola]